ncbi:MAG: ketopantoate reductase family protein [Pseudolabrys sp.]
MAYRILILGASYGSLFGTKCLMAGHDVTLVCRTATASLINARGTEVRIKLKDETAHRAIVSTTLPGRLDAQTPDNVDPKGYDLVVLAMQEPQYLNHTIRMLLTRVAAARIPCLSLMNMPPPPCLKLIPAVDAAAAEAAYSKAGIWDRFDPHLMTLCSPDPQAARPAGEPANVLHVNLPTNFKAAGFAEAVHNAMLTGLADSIDAARFDGHDVPVKLRVHDSPFVPFAKWPMLLTGNYRCVTPDQPISIRQAVHADIELSRDIYAAVQTIVRRIGAQLPDLVPFEKYAAAAERLTGPSSVARTLVAGAPMVERVDKLVQLIGRQFGITHPALDYTVMVINAKLARNRLCAA